MKTGFSLSPGLTGIWKRRKVVFIIGTLVVAFNVFFLLRHFITIRRTKTAIQREQSFAAPLCTENILEKRSFHYKGHQQQEGNLAIIPAEGCRLHYYSKDDVVECIDKKNKTNLHIAFYGDSRIRQQYVNFLTMIPDLDRPLQELLEISLDKARANITITVPLLQNMSISVRWRAVIDDDLVKEFSSYLVPESSSRDVNTTVPNFVLIGISAHHMFVDFRNDHRPFERGLRRLVPILEQLCRGYDTKIVWMIQFPTVDFFAGETNYTNGLIYAEKLEHYNAIVRRFIKKSSCVHLWTSAGPLVEDYVRGCSLHFERGGDLYPKSWAECHDFIHTGYNALSQATQILLNDICNAEMKDTL